MSGGSMNYLYQKVQDASFPSINKERAAFRLHLNLVAAALRAIEWSDSGDSGEDEAVKAIMKVISRQDVLASTLIEAKVTMADLKDAMTAARRKK